MFMSRDVDVFVDVLEVAGASSDLGSAEFSWRLNVVFVFNYIFSVKMGL